jgi:hypothetical protein
VFVGVTVGVTNQYTPSKIQPTLSIILIIKVSSAEGDGTTKVYGKKVTPL